MKVETRSGSVEREVLVGMITSHTVCGRIASRWNDREGLFASKWANQIGKWCKEYYDRHGKAPRDSIRSMFVRWSEKTRDTDAVQLVESFLSTLSEEHSRRRKVNADHVIDLAGEHFEIVRVRKVRDLIDQHLEHGRIAEASALVPGRVELGAGSCIDLLQDMEALKDAFVETTESIVKYPGAMERFMQGAMEQDGFISFLAPNKSGKSWFLEDFAWRAMCQRLRVAYFQVGDMSRRRVILRLATRAARHPRRAREWPCTIQYPKKISVEDNQGSVAAEERSFTSPLSFAQAMQAFEKVAKRTVRSDQPYFKLMPYPNMGITVRGIAEELRRLERDGWKADTVVIDYMDNLAPIDARKELRNQINETWSMTRALSLDQHVLVVTATQADSASFGAKRLLSRDNFTDSRTKLDHVTGMLGINVSTSDKEQGLARLNWVNLREGDGNELEVCHVAGCLAIGNPIIQTHFKGRDR